MTPHKRNQRGTYVLDRVFDSVGRIRRASGTTDLETFKAIDAMLTNLQSLGRPDLLELIRDGHVKPVTCLGWYRLGRLDRIPTGEMLRPLASTWEAWVAGRGLPRRTAQDIGYTLKALGDGTVGDVVRLFQQVKTAKAAHPRTVQKMKAHCQAFLRDTVGIHHRLYQELQNIRVTGAVSKRAARLLTPDEVAALCGRMPEGQAEVWSLCATGMLPKEYWGVWRIVGHRVEIDGTKRKGRKRAVPYWRPVVRPSMWAGKLARLVREASDGTVQLKDFRNTFGRWMELAGISRLNRKLWMGHGASSMTEHYELGEIAGQFEDGALKLRAFCPTVALRLHQERA